MEVMNRFKGLDLVDKMPKELCTEVCNTVQEVVTKTIPKKMKCKKAKRLSEDSLYIAEERREAKSNGERERYTQLNEDFLPSSDKTRPDSPVPTLQGPCGWSPKASSTKKDSTTSRKQKRRSI